MDMNVGTIPHTQVHHYCFTYRPNPDQTSCPLNVFHGELRFQIFMCFETNLTVRYNMGIINELITLIFCRLVLTYSHSSIINNSFQCIHD